MSERTGRPRCAGSADFSRVLVVIERPNPSCDYYLAPRLEMAGGPPFRLVSLKAATNRLEIPDLHDALLIFCRYLTQDWIDAIDRQPPAATALFLDDDLVALAADPSVPWHLRRRYQRFGPALWPQLDARLDRLWVSTPELLRRHATSAPVLIPPVPDPVDLRATPGAGEVSAFHIAYHASSTHADECRWIFDLARRLRARSRALRFEITVGGLMALAGRCQGFQTIRRRPWPEYREATARRSIQLMLAPLLPTRVNAARAETKRIDAARCGAALLVSDALVYPHNAEESRLGMRIPLDIGAWCDAIMRLGEERGRLHRLAWLNHEHVAGLRRDMQPLFVPSGAGRWALRPASTARAAGL